MVILYCILLYICLVVTCSELRMSVNWHWDLVNMDVCAETGTYFFVFVFQLCLFKPALIFQMLSSIFVICHLLCDQLPQQLASSFITASSCLGLSLTSDISTRPCFRISYQPLASSRRANVHYLLWVSIEFKTAISWATVGLAQSKTSFGKLICSLNLDSKNL